MYEGISRAMAASGLALIVALVPMSALHSQQGTWGTTPGSKTTPGTTTTTGTTTGTTPGQTTVPNQNAQADVRADAAFVQEAASGNMMEVQLGQTAQVRASNAAVKQFGQRMVNDHTNLENQLAN